MDLVAMGCIWTAPMLSVSTGAAVCSRSPNVPTSQALVWTMPDIRSAPKPGAEKETTIIPLLGLQRMIYLISRPFAENRWMARQDWLARVANCVRGIRVRRVC